MLMNLRTTFEAPTGDTADRLVYSIGIDGNVPDEVAMRDLADAVEGALLTVVPTASNRAPASLLQGGYRMIFHEVFDAQGGPALNIIDAGTTPDPVGDGLAGPTEVQLVVSKLITTPRGLLPVGRAYFGPIPGGVGTGRRPDTTQQTLLANWALNQHQNLQFVGYTPKIIAKQGTVLAAGKNIAGYRVDQLWDTQRRRGTATALPNTRVTVLT